MTVKRFSMLVTIRKNVLASKVYIYNEQLTLPVQFRIRINETTYGLKNIHNGISVKKLNYNNTGYKSLSVKAIIFITATSNKMVTFIFFYMKVAIETNK